VWTGTVYAGETLTGSWTSSTRGSGATQTQFDFYVNTSGTSTHLAGLAGNWGTGAQTLNYTPTSQVTVDVLLEGGGEPANTSFGQVDGFSLVLTSSAGYCQYGTQPQPSAAVTEIVTPVLVDAILTAVALDELAPIFDVLWYSSLNVQEMCAAPAPPMPPLDLSLLTAAPSVIAQLFQALAWPYFCQCSPGTPTPIPFPPPSGTVPPGWPTQPTFPCADTDLCAAIVAMQKQLAALQNSMFTVQDLVQAVQRFRVPFSYVGGTQHTNLTGSGTFDVSRLVGFQVVLSHVPDNVVVISSSPDYVWNAGWMSVTDGGGMLQQRRIARQSMTWIPDQCQDATVFGYFLEQGFAANVVELLPEP
jgi:hypothetical protein